MKIECAFCGSHQTERLALTYGQGTARTRGWAFGMNPLGPALGMLVAVAKAFPAALGILGLPMGLLALVAAAPMALVIDFVFVAIMASLSLTRWRGTTQTYLATEAAPPPRFRTGLNAIRALVAVLIGSAFTASLIAASGFGDAVAEPAIGHLMAAMGTPSKRVAIGLVVATAALPALGLTGAGLMAGVRYNRAVWPLREAAWQRTFLCKRCGGTFLVPDFDPYGVNRIRSDKAGQGKGQFLPHAATEAERTRIRGKAHADGYWLRGSHRQRQTLGRSGDPPPTSNPSGGHS